MTLFTKRTFRNQENLRRLCAKLVQITDDVLFGDIWERPELSKRDRSLVTVTALIAAGNTEPFHLKRARENKRHGGRVHRNHHPSGILLRVAQGHLRYRGRQRNLQALAPP